MFVDFSFSGKAELEKNNEYNEREKTTEKPHQLILEEVKKRNRTEIIND